MQHNLLTDFMQPVLESKKEKNEEWFPYILCDYHNNITSPQSLFLSVEN